MSQRDIRVNITGKSNLEPTARRVKQSLGTVDRALATTARQTQALDIANRRLGQNLGGSTWKRQVQQAGMQISDFSVQVAGGQSAILAFTQNAPQFLQNFGAMGGVIAAAVTILGTFAFAMERTREKTISYADAADAANTSSTRLFDVIEGRGGSAAAIFEKMRTEIEGFAAQSEALLQGAQAQAAKDAIALADSVGRLALDNDWFKGEVGEIAQVLGVSKEALQEFEGGVNSNAVAVSKVNPIIREFQDALAGLETAEGVQGHYDALLAIKTQFHDVVNLTDESTKGQLEFNLAIEDALTKLLLVGAAEKAVAEESTEELRLRQLQAIEMRRLVGLGQERLETQRNDEVTEELRLRQLQAIEMRRLVGLGQERAEAQRVAHMRAVEMTRVMGAQAEYARTIAGQTRNAYAAMQQYVTLRSMTPGQTPEDQRAQRTLELMLLQNQALRTQLALGEDNATTAVMHHLVEHKRYTQMLDSLNVTQEMRDEMVAAWTEQQRLNDAIASQGDEIVNTVVPQVEEAATQITTIFEDMQRVIGQSMLSGFKSVLKGAESFGDAARNILGNILDNIIDILMTPVFNQLATGIATGLGGSLGINMDAAVPSIGVTKSLPSFEGGGRTGFGARVGGIDGRGGQLMIGHPNETVIDHTKGQTIGGTTVVIHVHGVQDVQGFRRSQRQIAGEMRRAMEAY